MAGYTLRQLEYLVAVAEYGSVSAAATSLHVSQSTLSSGISELERALSLQLLVRHHAKGVSLTASGERLMVRARSMLDDAQSLEQDARDLGSLPIGPISIGVFGVIAPYVIPDLFSELHRKYPEVEARVTEVNLPELNEGVLSGKFEIGIGYDFGREVGIKVQRLFDVPAHIVVPFAHPLAQAGKIKLKQIAEEPIVLLDLPHSRDYFARAFKNAGFEPQIRYRSASAELVRAMVARGMGVALLNMRPGHNRSVDGHKFAMLEIEDPIQPARVVAMTAESTRPTKRVSAVLEVVTGLSSKS